jgi:hypothetical protein
MTKYLFGPILLIAGLALGWMAYHFQSWNSEWRTPIAFYGKVVDEKGMAVSNVSVDFSCNDVSATGTSTYQVKSDTNGLFSIRHIKGKLLVVAVGKDGYYASRADNNSFYYAGQNVNYVPNPAKPESFHLRKIGLAEPLIHIQAPMGGGKGSRIEKNGSPVELSLVSGKVVPPGQGDLRVECWTQEPKGSWKFDWRCRITVVNGGIQQYTNEFPFQAPVDGYTATDEIKMPVSLREAWGTSAKRSYFLALANGNYGRMTFEMVAGGDHFFQIESFLNPSRSRNLEFDPNKAIQVAN